jgi:hypothetical protein
MNNKMIFKVLKSCLLVAVIFLFDTTDVSAGTLDPFSYSAGSYLAGDTTDYTFTFTTETADPNMIFRALWGNNSGISLSEDVPTVTINGEEKIPSEYWWGGGSFHNPYIRMGIAIPGGSEIVIVIPNVTNGSAGTYSWANDIFTADSGANAIDRPASIESLTFVDDSTDPTVDTFSPADDETSVATDSNLVITFDESVDTETGNITIYETSDDSEVEAIDVTSGQVTGTGSTEITINPTTDLDEQTSYYVQIDATAFDDTAGNSFAGISDSTTWSFTTADESGPVVSSLSPTDNGTNVNRDSNLIITFNENTNVESGNVTIYKTSDDSEVEAIDVTSGQVTGSGSTEITINPSNNLDYSTEYYIQIDATAFDDTAGNSYAGISDSTTWSFTTEEEATNRIISSGSVSTIYNRNNVNTENSNNDNTNSISITPIEFMTKHKDLFMKLLNLDIDLPKEVSDFIEVLDDNIPVRDLEFGMEGEDVTALQKILISNGYSIPAGATGYFGLQTMYALDAYQLDNNISPRGGYFGPITRAQMKSAKLVGLWW